MESIVVEQDSDSDCGFENVSNVENVVEDSVTINLTLELKPQALEIKTPSVDVTDNSNDSDSRLEYRMTTKPVYDSKEDNCNKPALTFRTNNTISLGIINDAVRVDTAFGYKDGDDRLQHDYFLDDSCGNNLKHEFAAKDKYAQPKVSECDASKTILLLDSSDSLQKAVAFSNIDTRGTEAIGGNNDCNNYNEHEKVCHESQVVLQDDSFQNAETGTCFSAEIHMIYDNEDFFSEQDALGKGCCFDNSCHQTGSESGPHVGQSSSLYVAGLHGVLKHENPQIQANENEEYHSDQYENIEFSTIFSSVDIYQRSFDHSCTTENSSFLTENGDSCQNSITDLDSQSCEKSITHSGMFGLSLSDTGSTEFLQIDGPQYSHKVSSSDKFAIGLKTEYNNCVLLKPEEMHSAPTIMNAATNATSFTEQTTKLFNHPQAGQECNTDAAHNKSSTNLTSEALSFHYSPFDKTLSESSVYDPCLSDYNNNYQRCFYQSPQSCSATSTEWSQWVKEGGSQYDIRSPFICSKQTDERCSVSSTDVRGNVPKPEIVQFLQMEEKDEETDDADEIGYLPIPLNTKSDCWSHHMGVESAGTTVYHCDNPSAGYNHSVLTPPPSASSTPVPSTSQESCISNDVDDYNHWPTSHYDAAHTYIPSALQARACKLKNEQLETSLLSFGLSQGAKRPFPSMADVMRSHRSKSSHKKCALEEFDLQPRRSGRPRKTQIQSDKISTTAMGNKQRKKPASKSKSDMMANDGPDLGNSSDDRLETGSSKMPGSARHNEPLNQRAIEIMSQWFDEHIDNPYPSKDDKDKMATQGVITENQVKSWFANKRNRTNNTKPKVQKRAMQEKLKEIFRDLKRNHQNPMADNSRVIQQLSGIIQHCHSAKQD